jgi:Pirin-related protein
MFYAHMELEEGPVAEIPASYSERAAYVTRGEIDIGGSPVTAGQMAVLSRGASFMRAVRPSHHGARRSRLGTKSGSRPEQRREHRREAGLCHLTDGRVARTMSVRPLNLMNWQELGEL